MVYRTYLVFGSIRGHDNPTALAGGVCGAVQERVLAEGVEYRGEG